MVLPTLHKPPFPGLYSNPDDSFNSLNTELNPICHLLTLLGAHHILHVSRVRVNYYTQQGGHISELRISKLVFFFVTCFDGNEEELRICSLEPSYRVIKENAISS